jgi:hypothetical protein
VLPEGKFDVIVPGLASELITLTLRLTLEEVPHPLTAFTESVPVPGVPATLTFMLFVVEEPDHPLGTVHIYDAAPATGVTL